LQLLQYQFIFP
jgi:hypothetical protein